MEKRFIEITTENYFQYSLVPSQDCFDIQDYNALVAQVNALLKADGRCYIEGYTRPTIDLEQDIIVADRVVRAYYKTNVATCVRFA